MGSRRKGLIECTLENVALGRPLGDISALGIVFLGLAISQSDRKMSLSLRKVPVPVKATRHK